MIEGYFTPLQISKKAGIISPEAVRSACRRKPSYHPLPHIQSGLKRPRFYIRWESFVEWLREEEYLNARYQRS